MKMPSFPHKVTKRGVSVTIGRVEKDGQNFFRVLSREQGKRKRAWRSSFEDHKARRRCAARQRMPRVRKAVRVATRLSTCSTKMVPIEPDTARRW